MKKRLEVYKCNMCGNIVEIVHGSMGDLVCCNQPMVLMSENTVDAAVEKHVPEIHIEADGVRVVVGAVEHPMEEKHYIEWIELIAGDFTYRKHLKPGAKPEAFFPVKPASFYVREYCNLHGLWKKES